MKKIISVVLALSLLCAVGLAFAEGPGGRGGNEGPGGGQGGMRGGNGGGTDKSSDTELQSMITEVAPKFQLLTFEDVETGTSLQYQLYIPENYDETQSYPLIQFIPDSSVVGKGTDAVLTPLGDLSPIPVYGLLRFLHGHGSWHDDFLLSSKIKQRQTPGQGAAAAKKKERPRNCVLSLPSVG